MRYEDGVGAQLYALPGTAVQIRMDSGLRANYSYYLSDDEQAVRENSFYTPMSTCCRQPVIVSRSGLLKCTICPRVMAWDYPTVLRSHEDKTAWLAEDYDPLLAHMLAEALDTELISRVGEVFARGLRWHPHIFDGSRQLLIAR